MSYKVSEYPKMIPLCIEEGFCNMSCPKCPVHGDDPRHDDITKGKMDVEHAIQMYDELKDKNLSITPSGVTEPLMQKDFFEHVKALNERNIKITLNSNGLLIDKSMAEKLVHEYDIASITISIDAMTKETLRKTRDSDKLDKINQAVELLLETRNSPEDIRIGVSFTVEDANRDEKESFIDYWIKKVDVIRVNELYQYGDETTSFQKDRKPCPVLYDTLYIGIDGNARICCLDTFDETSVGNVFTTSVKEVWHSKEFNQIRKYHEDGGFEKVPFCRNCQDWARYIFHTEYEENDILIRKSDLITYYNRLDRLSNWKKSD